MSSEEPTIAGGAPRLAVGIDPGRNGAACLIEGTRLLLVASWRPSQKAGRAGYAVSIRSCGREFARWRATPNEIGRDVVGEIVRIAGPSPALLVGVEEVYVGCNVSTAISLARMSGALSGPVEALSGGPARYVAAAGWRASVIGLARRATAREDAKRLAMERIPPLVEGWTLLVGNNTEHIADAVGIALATLQPPTEKKHGKKRRDGGGRAGVRLLARPASTTGNL